ncbi:MAG: response regulator, partial [Chloroflexota bacterium]
MVRKGLVVLLHEFDDIEVVAEASDGEVAISTCVRYEPDVVLMDIIMPHINGIVATEKIRELCPNTQIVALTSFSEEDQIHAALQAGAIGYIMKDVSGNELADAIRRAHVGESTLSPQAAQVLIRATT